MKTLIINGSPRKNGDTAALIDELTQHLSGEVRIISCYDNISPCLDCRFCWKNEGCAVKDDMQEIYEYLTDCDNVVLASPVWFSSLSGPALNLASRFQTYFSARRFRNVQIERTPKKGLILLAVCLLVLGGSVFALYQSFVKTVVTNFIIRGCRYVFY